jgi:hypothetical protein
MLLGVRKDMAQQRTRHMVVRLLAGADTGHEIRPAGALDLETGLEALRHCLADG